MSGELSVRSFVGLGRLAKVLTPSEWSISQWPMASWRRLYCPRGLGISWIRCLTEGPYRSDMVAAVRGPWSCGDGQEETVNDER